MNEREELKAEIKAVVKRLQPYEVEALAAHLEQVGFRKTLELGELDRWIMSWGMEEEIKTADGEWVRFEDLRRLAAPVQRYIRFGLPPQDGRSTNHLDPQNPRKELGVSVWPAFLYNGQLLPLLPAKNHFAAVDMEWCMDRPWFEVFGEVIGIGSDGEPLMNITACLPIPYAHGQPSPLPPTTPAKALPGTQSGEGVCCANCKEPVKPCACERNRCNLCGGPVGNITFSRCDDCWNKDANPAQREGS